MNRTAAPAEPSKKAPEGTLSGWGRIPLPGSERFGEDLAGLSASADLCRGLGRSYGDSSLPARPTDRVVNTVLADRLLSFDPASGRVRAEAGFSVRELYRVFLKQGWFTPVTPGTSFVTLGGMVASDVHGKNHHSAGTIGRHITALRVRVADGRVIDCSPQQEPELFWGTIGGMGLTGHVLEVELQLEAVPSPWILQESERIPNIDTFLERLEATAHDWPMTVGWIDCVTQGPSLGRGLLMCGRWARPEEAPKAFPRQLPRLKLPFVLPDFVLGPLSVRAFNTAFYWKHIPQKKRGIVHPETYFYPLDAILDWNKAYGKRGFTQYQAVLPKDNARRSARAFLELLTREGGASFLCVIKDCGPEGSGLLSFPRPGVSVALDIKMTDRTQHLIDALNAFVIAEGGRIYLTKDQLTRPEDLRRMEPRLDRFTALRRKWDPQLRIRSAQSVRLLGDPPLPETTP